ncbi:MAG: secretin N-terminal domain-containing protein [Paraperlucidibaca sp.]
MSKASAVIMLLWIFAGALLYVPPAHAASLRVSLKDADVRAVIVDMALAAKVGVLLSDRVQGQLTIEANARDRVGLLDAVLHARGLARELVGDVFWVAPLDEITQRDTQARAKALAQESRELLLTELIELHHAKAPELVKLLSSAGTGERLLGPRGRVDADSRTNTLLVTDHAARLAQLKTWLITLDRASRQVLIETRLVSVSRNKSSAYGAQWAFTRANGNGLIPLLASTADASAIRYGLLGIDGPTLDLTLSALVSEGDGKILARPSVMTAEQQPARIASGQQIPYQETTQSGASTTRFINAELSLDIVPAIAPSGDIQLNLKLSHDSPGELQANGSRAIDTNRLETQVRLRDGQTLVLGGIFRQQAVKASSAVPFLGKIPVLGALFRRDTMRQDEQELFIFVTPRLINDAVYQALEAGTHDAPGAGEEHFFGRPDGRG